MQKDSVAGQVARWVALSALFLIPLAPLVVVNGFFFPFISGKAFYLRTLIEIAVAGWAVLALLDANYRPRFSWVGVAVLGFVGWMFIADLFAINVGKAFWSNFERMEGWVLLVHLLGFFVAAGAVLRVERKWRAWFLTSLGVSLVISGYALLQIGGVFAIHQGSYRIDATLGNSAYLAVYFLFSVFVALWLALTEKYAWFKWSLMALAALEGVLIFFTGTRGTIIGLTLGLLITSLLTAVTARGKARTVAAVACAAILLSAGTLYLGRHSDFVQNNSVLQRIAAVSPTDGKTRFTLWHMAWEGFLERPVVGWGQEGFNYVFNKYYEPSLYDQEQWFDRAHNTFIDWLTAGGLPAFLFYISLFVTAIVLLWRSPELSRPERIALTAALVGYAVHNLFVFDNLYSYIYFFALLSLIDSQVGKPFSRLERAPVLSESDGMTYALPVAAVVACALIWFVNITGIQTSTKLIAALSSSDPSKTMQLFAELVARPNFALQEIREQLVSYASAVVQNSQVTNEQKQQAVSLAATEMQKQVAAYPLDTRGHMELSYVYRTGGDGANALKELESALALSPNKEGILIEKGILEFNLGDTKAAQADFNTAYALGPQFTDLAAYAAAGDIVAGDLAAADKILIAAFGTTNVDNDILSAAYFHTQNWSRLVEFWQLRVAKPGATAETWFSLAAAYYAAGDKASAIRTINKAVTLFPEAAASGAQAIKQIQGK